MTKVFEYSQLEEAVTSFARNEVRPYGGGENLLIVGRGNYLKSKGFDPKGNTFSSKKRIVSQFDRTTRLRQGDQK